MKICRNCHTESNGSTLCDLCGASMLRYAHRIRDLYEQGSRVDIGCKSIQVRIKLQPDQILPEEETGPIIRHDMKPEPEKSMSFEEKKAAGYYAV